MRKIKCKARDSGWKGAVQSRVPSEGEILHQLSPFTWRAPGSFACEMGWQYDETVKVMLKMVKRGELLKHPARLLFRQVFRGF